MSDLANQAKNAACNELDKLLAAWPMDKDRKDQVRRFVADAVRSERERCANVASGWRTTACHCDPSHGTDVTLCHEAIAAEIRKDAAPEPQAERVTATETVMRDEYSKPSLTGFATPEPQGERVTPTVIATNEPMKETVWSDPVVQQLAELATSDAASPVAVEVDETADLRSALTCYKDGLGERTLRDRETRIMTKARLGEAQLRLNKWPPLGAVESVESLKRWIFDRTLEQRERIAALTEARDRIAKETK